MDKKNENTYFVLVKIGETSDRNQVLETLQKLKDCFIRISGSNYESVFSSQGFTYTGYIIKTHLSVYTVKAYILGTTFDGGTFERFIDPEIKHTSCLLAGDSVLILKVADKVDGQGFSRLLGWLQHH